MPIIGTTVTADRLEKIKEARDIARIPTIPDMIERALDLYEAIIREGDEQAKLVVHLPDGMTKIIPIFRS